MNAKSRQNNANMLIYTPASNHQYMARPLSKGSGSQVNIGGITDQGDIQTSGPGSSLALRLSPSALLRIGQSSNKRMTDLSF